MLRQIAFTLRADIQNVSEVQDGEDIAVTFAKPGVYGVKCLPHHGMGMVALVVVGTPENVDAAKTIAQPGKAKQVMAGLFDRLAAAKTAEK